MTKKTKKYTLTAQDIQAYLCELGIKPTKEVSIYSIEYYFDKQTVSTDKLSVEKLQEIRVEELKDFNSKILQAELKNQKLQEQLNTAKKALTEIYTQPEDDGTISIDEYPSQIRYYAQDALAAIGGDDE